MKKIKIIGLSSIILFMIYLSFYQKDAISLEGNWSAKRIVIDGKSLYPTEIHNYLDFEEEILINDWNKSISLPNPNKTLNIKYDIIIQGKDRYQIELKSNITTLNGTFPLQLDTLHLGPLAYDVYATIQSKNLLISMVRKVRFHKYEPELLNKRSI